MDAPIKDSYYEDEYVEYAGFWLRVVAYIIDAIIISIPISILSFLVVGGSFMAGGGLENLENLENDPEAAMAAGGTMMAGMGIIYVLTIIGSWLYFALMESSAKQATVGKMALGIKVTNEYGERISFGNATGRFFGKIVSGIILYIGFIMAAFTEKKQALHDIIAKTLVVRQQR